VNAALWSDALTLFRREWLRYRRDRAYWIGQLVFPLAVVAVIGVGLERVVSLPSGASYPAHLASGMLALLVGSGGVGAGFTLIEDRETGFLRALWIAPVSRASIVLGKLAARIAASLALVLVLALLLAGFTPLRIHHPMALAWAVAALTAVFVALGIALASRLRRLESFRLLAAFATVPLYLFSGIFYPLETLPAAMRWLAWLNPLSYGVDLIRYALLDVHEIPVAWGAGMLAALAAAACVSAVRLLEGRSPS
jgi:ABC-2 type transport system permease protein